MCACRQRGCALLKRYGHPLNPMLTAFGKNVSDFVCMIKLLSFIRALSRKGMEIAVLRKSDLQIAVHLDRQKASQKL